MSRKQVYRFVASAGLATALVSASAGAAITGFGDFSQFTITQNDANSPPTVPAAGTIELTNGGGEDRSIFADTPQNISSFTASFTYQARQFITFGANPGAAFVIEEDPRGAAAVGNETNNFGFHGITKSVGITLEIASDSTGIFTGGNITTGDASVSPVNLGSGDPINVQLTYTGSTLTETLTDTTTLASYTTTDLILQNFPTTVGSPTAYVGFTAGSDQSASEYFSNFQFTSVPEPASMVFLSAGLLPLLCRGRTRRGYISISQ